MYFLNLLLKPILIQAIVVNAYTYVYGTHLQKISALYIKHKYSFWEMREERSKENDAFSYFFANIGNYGRPLNNACPKITEIKVDYSTKPPIPFTLEKCIIMSCACKWSTNILQRKRHVENSWPAGHSIKLRWEKFCEKLTSHKHRCTINTLGCLDPVPQQYYSSSRLKTPALFPTMSHGDLAELVDHLWSTNRLEQAWVSILSKSVTAAWNWLDGPAWSQEH